MEGGTSAIVLLVLVISGYFFNQIYYRLRYHSSQAEGQKLFFMAASAGLVLGATVFGVTGVIKELDVFRGSFLENGAHTLDRAIPIPYACRLILTLAAAIVGGALANLLLRLRYWNEWDVPIRKLIYNKLTDEHGNAMSQLLRRAAVSQKLVLVTLHSRKIYCGRILEVPLNIEREDACIELLPLFSGYRDSEKLRLGKKRTHYPVIELWEARQYLFSRQRLLEMFDAATANRVIAHHPAVKKQRDQFAKDVAAAEAVLSRFGAINNLDIVDWNKVIPLKEIETASIYDPEAYLVWFTPPSSPASEALPDVAPSAQPEA